MTGDVERLRRICNGLDGAYEEAAWVGTRWRARGRTFAHVLDIDDGWPPAYARAVGAPGPVTVLMFRSQGDELEALRHAGPPFFTTPWRFDELGIVLDADTDWGEVAELVEESHRYVQRSARPS
jgi:hypothetical protein